LTKALIVRGKSVIIFALVEGVALWQKGSVFPVGQITLANTFLWRV